MPESAIVQAVRAQAARVPDRVAVVAGETTLLYAALERQASAAERHKQTCEREGRILTMGQRSKKRRGTMGVRRAVVSLVGIFALAAAASLHGAQSAPSYKLVGSGLWDTSVVKNLKKAVAAGYRVYLTSGPYGILMEKVPEGEERPDYLFIEELPRVVDEKVAKGYCYVRGTLHFDGDVGQHPAIFQRCPPAEQREYLVLHAEGTGTLQKEINLAVAQGWEFMDLATGGHPCAILERRKQSAGAQATQAPPSREDRSQPAYLFFAAEKYSSIEKNLQEAAGLGYRPLSAQPMGHDKFYQVGMILRRVGPSVQSNQYLILAATRAGTMEKEMNQAVTEGYRALPATFVQKTTFSGGEHGIVMEKSSGTPGGLVYKVLSKEKDINRAIEQGYRVSGMAKRGNWLLMEKPRPPETPSP